TFTSATEALRCAIEIQRELAQRNARLPAADQIRFRMGLNVGDILFDEHDIAGVSVNLAARLEALARPGEICISRALKEQVQEDLHVRYIDAGSKRVKNISQRVRVYHVFTTPVSTWALLALGMSAFTGTIARWIAAASAAAGLALFSVGVTTPQVAQTDIQHAGNEYFVPAASVAPANVPNHVAPRSQRLLVNAQSST